MTKTINGKLFLNNESNIDEDFSNSEYTFKKDSKIYYDQLNRLNEAFGNISNPIVREKLIEIVKMSEGFVNI